MQRRAALARFASSGGAVACPSRQTLGVCMTCPHSQIEAALDRWSECHWHIHQMEANYHSPDAFRYAFNSFIRAIKEIPQVLQMELQNHPMYQAHFKPSIATARSDPLLSLLHKKRDFVVHRGMLEIGSKGIVGTTEGRGIKIAIGFYVSPSETTQEAYIRFKEVPRRFVWNPTLTLDSLSRARWAGGLAAFEPVHMSTGRCRGVES